MSKISYARHRIPATPIRKRGLAVFSISAGHSVRGINVSYKAIRCWIFKFGSAIDSKLRPRRVRLCGTWQLDEVFVQTAGKRTYLWRAVDDEGEVLEASVQTRRSERAA